VGPLVEFAEAVMFAAGAAVVRTVAAVVRTVVFFTGTAVVPFTVVCAFGVVDVRDGGVTGVAGVAVVLGGPAVVVVVVGPGVGTSGPTNCCHLTVTFLSMRS